MTSIKLTDTQLVLMSAAAQREDHCLVASQQLRGNAAAKVAAKLIETGYAEEIPAKAGLPVWRRNGEGDSFALKLTAAGLKAIGVEGEQEAEPEASRQEHEDKFGWSRETGGLQPVGPEARSPASPPPIGGTAASASSGGDDNAPEAVSAQAPSQSAAARDVDAGRSQGAVTAPRSGTKLDSLIALLVRPEGATLEELTQAVGWLPHTTRAAITGLRKRNYRVSRTREEDRGSVYRIGASEGRGGSEAGAKPDLAGSDHAESGEQRSEGAEAEPARDEADRLESGEQGFEGGEAAELHQEPPQAADQSNPDAEHSLGDNLPSRQTA